MNEQIARIAADPKPGDVIQKKGIEVRVNSVSKDEVFYVKFVGERHGYLRRMPREDWKKQVEEEANELEVLATSVP